MIYKIYIKSKNCVFMYGEDNIYFSVLKICSNKLKSIWDPRQMNDRSNETWYVNKYNKTEECFLKSSLYPVPMPIIGGIHDYGTDSRIMRFNDGITRVHWLIDHEAHYFPLLCPKEFISELSSLAGM